MDKHKKKLRDELAQLETYVMSLKDGANRALSTLQDDFRAHRGSPTAASLVTHLQKQLEELKVENAALRNALPRSPSGNGGNQQDASRAALEDASRAAEAKRGAVLEAAHIEDTKRIASLEADCRTMQDQLAQARVREKQHRAATAELQAKADALEKELQAALSQLRQNGKASSSQSSQKDGAAINGIDRGDRQVAVQGQITAVRNQIAKLREDKDDIEGQVVEMYQAFFSDKIVKGLVSVLKKKEAAFVSSSSVGAAVPTEGTGSGGKPLKLKARLDEAQARVEELLQQIEWKDSEISALQRHHDDNLKIQRLESEGQLSLYKERWATELLKRKKLLQKVLELKGAIRVFCRVRPIVTKEDGNTVPCVIVRDEENLHITVDREVSSTETDGGSGSTTSGSTRRPPSRASSRTPPRRNGTDDDDSKPSRSFSYEFDRVFSPDDSQETVYEDVEDLIVSVADGYNVCIMAYGQTGSGKTYTMQGPCNNPGINTRALRSLFALCKEREAECSMTFTTSILEIYNDSIFDLLSDTPRESASRLDIKEQGGHIWIPYLQMVKVTSMSDVERLIEQGTKNRSTFATDMNEHSSRSHLILSMYLRCDNKLTGEKTASKLHLIDLAGSERVSRSHAEGDRLREAQNINMSLSALGDVIQALQHQKDHIPYRNCKLTRLLSDSLSGQSKTLLVVNLSPTRESGGESRSSCEFASRAKKVELGKASKQIEGGSEVRRTSPGNARSFSTSRAKSAHQLSADPTKLRSAPHY